MVRPGFPGQRFPLRARGFHRRGRGRPGSTAVHQGIQNLRMLVKLAPGARPRQADPGHGRQRCGPHIQLGLKCALPSAPTGPAENFLRPPILTQPLNIRSSYQSPMEVLR